MKSQEQRGATKPNIIELGFASDGDATTFAANLALVTSSIVVSVDHEIAANYATPYPAGKNAMTRSALNDGAGHWGQLVVFDTPDDFAPVTRQTALVAAGFNIVMPDLATTYLITSCATQVFTPGPSGP